jgi:hypothetical protein
MSVFPFCYGGVEVSLKMEDVTDGPGEKELHFEDITG